MNCKPGDLAIVVRDNYGLGALGKLVEVLYAAPPYQFQLPNGRWNEPASDPGKTWVLRILGAPLRPPGFYYLTEYGTGHDNALRPIKGLPVDEKIDEEITA